MKKSVFARLVMLGVGAAMFASGCGWNGLTNNIWKGFGYSLGGIPANIVVTLVDDFIDIPGVNDTN
jgi:hypothetical protein